MPMDSSQCALTTVSRNSAPVMRPKAATTQRHVLEMKPLPLYLDTDLKTIST